MAQPLVQCSRLYHSFNAQPLFVDLRASIHEGEICALIGENGSGKTTLLRAFSGLFIPDEGEIVRKQGLTTGFLSQEVLLKKQQKKVRDFLEENRLSHLEERMADSLQEPSQLAEWEKLHEEYERLGGYRRLPLAEVCENLGITLLEDRPIETLSQGERMRVFLAKALIENPELLLLDEPTNHLDSAMRAWLHHCITHRKGATLLVSHDRQFLNATCHQLWHLQNGQIAHYGGNYDFFLQELERRGQKEREAYEAQQEKKRTLKHQLRSLTCNKKKPPPPSDPNTMAYDYRGEAYQQSLHTKIRRLREELSAIEKNPVLSPKPKNLTGLYFSPFPFNTHLLISIEEASVRFGKKPIFSHLAKTVHRGNRIVIQGPNGCGKTTFLRSILGEIPLESGSIRLVPNAKIAYLDQEAAAIPWNETPCHYLMHRYRLSEEKIRSEFHKAALGSPEALYRPFHTMSTGQRKRILLLSLVLERPNVLLLDEPTNHLDLLTLEALEKALLRFDGALLVVSHDAAFTEKIATEIWSFPSL